MPLILGVLALAGGLFLLYSQTASASIAETPISFGDDMDNNVKAFAAFTRQVEANGRYNIIAGGDTFDDYDEHPFILDPSRDKPLGTTASGGYQMVVGTWKMARDALGLQDFTPQSQDAAFVWIVRSKNHGAYDLIASGDFLGALKALRHEWESFDRILKGTYSVSLSSAVSIYQSQGGNLA